MFRRHPIVTVLVVVALGYMLITAPMVVIDSFGALGGLAAKFMDSVMLALSEVV